MILYFISGVIIGGLACAALVILLILSADTNRWYERNDE